MVRGVQDLVVEYGVVESKPQSNRVSALQVLSLSSGYLVRVLGLLNDCLTPKCFQLIIRLLFCGEEFSKVSVVVTLHFEEEDLGLGVLGVGDEGIIEKSEHVIADVLKFLFDLLSVLLDQVHKSGSLKS